MKKLSALLLVMALLVSLFALASCDDKDNDKDKDKDTYIETLAGKSPEELYQSVKSNLAEATSYVVDSNQVIVMTYGNEKMTMNQSVVTKVQGDNSYMKSFNDMTTAANMEVWYVDGIIYSNTANGKLQASMDKEQFMQNYMGKDPSESTLLDIPESWFEGMKFKQDGEKWVLEITISEEKYEQYFAKLDLGADVDILGDVQYDIYFDKDGNLEKIITVVDYEIQGVNCHCDTVSNVSLEVVQITPPADADSYMQGYIQ